jgi:hypothetical protein
MAKNDGNKLLIMLDCIQKEDSLGILRPHPTENRNNAEKASSIAVVQGR